ncbi:rhomboid family intramembrane serine protease [Candidatus Sumerlaeota bacterium]|nr:rhomboid family intramembrane serine protease [Candidatus Sumerlaeota bacterium]
MGFLQRIDRSLSRRLTPAVKTIFLVNLFVFIAIRISFALFPGERVHFIVFNFLAEDPDFSVVRLLLYEFVTYMFVHVEPFHFLFNMAILWFFAPELEDRWRTSRFWRFYLTTGIGTGFFHALIALVFGSERGTLMGASAPLLGVLLAISAYAPHRMAYLFGIFPVKLKWLMPILVLIMLFAFGRVGDGVSNVTHVAGIGVAFFYLARYHRTGDIRRWRYMG